MHRTMARPPPLPGPERARRSPSAARPAVRGPERGECRRGPRGTAGSGAGGRLVAPARPAPGAAAPLFLGPLSAVVHTPDRGPLCVSRGPDRPRGDQNSPRTSHRARGAAKKLHCPPPPSRPRLGAAARRVHRPGPGSPETQPSCTCSLPGHASSALRTPALPRARSAPSASFPTASPPRSRRPQPRRTSPRPLRSDPLPGPEVSAAPAPASRLLNLGESTCDYLEPSSPHNSPVSFYWGGGGPLEIRLAGSGPLAILAPSFPSPRPPNPSPKVLLPRQPSPLPPTPPGPPGDEPFDSRSCRGSQAGPCSAAPRCGPAWRGRDL